MEFNWILKAIYIFFIGTFILRIGGRKSISQMTISQTIVMIGLGSLLVQPLADKGLMVTFASAFLLTLLMIVTEYLQLKVDFLETFFTGKAVTVIEDGVPNIKNLRKIRMTIDKLETRLRQSGISSIEDVRYATIEVSGQLGYDLKEEKKPLIKEDINLIIDEIAKLKTQINYSEKNLPQKPQGDIFKEIKTKEFEGNKNEP